MSAIADIAGIAQAATPGFPACRSHRSGRVESARKALFARRNRLLRMNARAGMGLACKGLFLVVGSPHVNSNTRVPTLHLGDALVIVAITTLLAGTLLVQVARRSGDCLRVTMGHYDFAVHVVEIGTCDGDPS
jgi:hypothetical protein